MQKSFQGLNPLDEERSREVIFSKISISFLDHSQYVFNFLFSEKRGVFLRVKLQTPFEQPLKELRLSPVYVGYLSNAKHRGAIITCNVIVTHLWLQVIIILDLLSPYRFPHFKILRDPFLPIYIRTWDIVVFSSGWLIARSGHSSMGIMHVFVMDDSFYSVLF